MFLMTKGKQIILGWGNNYHMPGKCMPTQVWTGNSYMDMPEANFLANSSSFWPTKWTTRRHFNRFHFNCYRLLLPLGKCFPN